MRQSIRPLLGIAFLGLIIGTASAAPPITEPVDVSVTNPVLPVEVSNADPIPVSVVAPQPDVRCGTAFVGSVSGAAGSVKRLSGSTTVTESVCPEMYVDYVMLDPSTTTAVDVYRLRLALEPSGGGDEVMLGVLTFDTAMLKLPMPIHLVPGMKLTFNGECTPATGATEMKCAFGYNFIGRSIGSP